MGLFGSRQNRGHDHEGAGSSRGGATPQHGQPQAPESPASGSAVPEPTPVSPESSGARSRSAERASAPQAQASKGGKTVANMGQSIVFKGELTGDEDLEIEGQVEGDVNLANHQLTIGANGRVKAEVHAKSILVIGKVTGNLIATERIEIQASGVVEGDVKAPRLLVQEGAMLNGRIDMSGGPAGASSATASSTSPNSPNSPTPKASHESDAVRKSA